MMSPSEDIIFNILLNCPVKSLGRFRCVSKSWFNLITNPNFVKMQLDYSVKNNKFNLLLGNENVDSYGLRHCHFFSIPCDPSSPSSNKQKVDIFNSLVADIIGSCNGLLCIKFFLLDDLILLNPSTTEYKVIPSLPLFKDDGYSQFYGFGYDNMIDDYKLVRVVSYFSLNVSEVQVYTLGSNSWQTIQTDIPYILNVRQQSTTCLPILFFNGAFHWIPLDTKFIFSFDIVDEKFRELPLPADNWSPTRFQTELSVLGGCLCIFNYVLSDGVELWVMNEYGVVESWTRMFIVYPLSCIHQPKRMLSFNNGNILFVVQLCCRWGCNEHGRGRIINYTLSYKYETGRCRIIDVSGTPKGFVESAYVESLVSLKSGTYLGKSKELRRKDISK